METIAMIILFLTATALFSIWFLISARRNLKKINKEKAFGKRTLKQMEKVIR